jgi:uncharacterized membrane protein YcaP (DUF421 family)
VFFQNWGGLIRVMVIGVLAYSALVLLLRISGKRTLTKMNAFDLVVTVALGSTLATIVMSKDVALAEGVLAFAVLILLQFVVTWLSVRFEGVRKIVKSEPRLLYYGDQFLDEAMRSERVTRDEILAAMRSSGHAAMESVEAVILETDASFSVLGKSSGQSGSTLETVQGYPQKQTFSY